MAYITEAQTNEKEFCFFALVWQHTQDKWSPMIKQMCYYGSIERWHVPPQSISSAGQRFAMSSPGTVGLL